MTRYITLAEYLAITELATGFPAEELLRSGRIDLADSALHAPQAGFDDQDFSDFARPPSCFAVGTKPP